jgi:hypothetical protein
MPAFSKMCPEHVMVEERQKGGDVRRWRQQQRSANPQQGALITKPHGDRLWSTRDPRPIQDNVTLSDGFCCKTEIETTAGIDPFFGGMSRSRRPTCLARSGSAALVEQVVDANARNVTAEAHPRLHVIDGHRAAQHGALGTSGLTS